MTTHVSMPATVLECLQFGDDVASGMYPGFQLDPPTTTKTATKFKAFVDGAKQDRVMAIKPGRTKKVSKDMALTVLKRLKELDDAVDAHLAHPTNEPILVVTKGTKDGVGLMLFEGLRDQIEEQVFERLSLDPAHLLCPPAGMGEQQQNAIWFGEQRFRLPVRNGAFATFRVHDTGKPLYKTESSLGDPALGFGNWIQKMAAGGYLRWGPHFMGAHNPDMKIDDAIVSPVDDNFKEEFARALLIICVNVANVTVTSQSQISTMMMERFLVYPKCNDMHVAFRVVQAALKHVHQNDVVGKLDMATVVALLDDVNTMSNNKVDYRSFISQAWKKFDDEGYDMTMPPLSRRSLDNPRAAHCLQWSTDVYSLCLAGHGEPEAWYEFLAMPSGDAKDAERNRIKALVAEDAKQILARGCSYHNCLYGPDGYRPQAGMRLPGGRPDQMLCMAHFRIVWFLKDGLKLPSKVIEDMQKATCSRLGSDPSRLMGWFQLCNGNACLGDSHGTVLGNNVNCGGVSSSLCSTCRHRYTFDLKKQKKAIDKKAKQLGMKSWKELDPADRVITVPPTGRHRSIIQCADNHSGCFGTVGQLRGHPRSGVINIPRRTDGPPVCASCHAVNARTSPPVYHSVAEFEQANDPRKLADQMAQIVVSVKSPQDHNEGIDKLVQLGHSKCPKVVPLAMMFDLWRSHRKAALRSSIIKQNLEALLQSLGVAEPERND